jgi:hypothetical protein
MVYLQKANESPNESEAEAEAGGGGGAMNRIELTIENRRLYPWYLRREKIVTAREGRLQQLGVF